MENETAEIGPNFEFGARPKLYILSLLHSSFFWAPKEARMEQKEKT
jgi:hypothetical protein